MFSFTLGITLIFGYRTSCTPLQANLSICIQFQWEIRGDAHRPKYWPKSFIHYLNSYGQDKVIFGTDFPVLEFKKSIDDIDELNLKPEVRKKLLRDNVIQIYGLDIDE